jgi:hypothetical protein
LIRYTINFRNNGIIVQVLNMISILTKGRKIASSQEIKILKFRSFQKR